VDQIQVFCVVSLLNVVMLVWPSFGSQKEQEKETECIKCSRKDLTKKKKKMLKKGSHIRTFPFTSLSQLQGFLEP
jgi:hypothetical protein